MGKNSIQGGVVTLRPQTPSTTGLSPQGGQSRLCLSLTVSFPGVGLTPLPQLCLSRTLVRMGSGEPTGLGLLPSGLCR